MKLRYLTAFAALVLLTGCAAQIEVGKDGISTRVDGNDTLISFDREGCDSGGRPQFSVNIHNEDTTARILYKFTKHENLEFSNSGERSGEVPASGTKKIMLKPVDPAKSVSMAIVQQRPTGEEAPGTQKIQGLEPRSC